MLISGMQHELPVSDLKVIGQKFKSQYAGVSEGPTPRDLVNLARENCELLEGLEGKAVCTFSY